ncbi:MAG: phage tail protein [Armatimonadota bacterium]
MTKFADRMLELLPEIYAESDTNGDLKTFLFVVGPTLDELKDRIDRIPDLVSPSDCMPDFLIYLAALLGSTYDPTSSPNPQRQYIKESIHRYRRMGTTTGLTHELRQLGWGGEIVETFRYVMRLSYRSKLNSQKLPGRRYNYGIYGIIDPLDDDIFTDTATRHQPAGTIMWLGEENNT